MLNKGVNWIFRFIVGGLFIFSGAVKANDVHGFTYRLEDYFNVFGMSFLDPIAAPLAALICLAEIFLGVALIIGALVTFTVNLLMIMIVFFSFLTFYSAYTGQVTDCGCFGDVLPLTPWESFYKNVFLLIFTGYLYANQSLIKPVFSKINNFSILWGITGISAIFTLFTWYYLPVFDVRPYAEGKDIYEQTLVQDDGEPIENEYKFIYRNENSGELFETTDAAEQPEGDNWVFEDREEISVAEREDPPIANFGISTLNGEDVSDWFFEQNGYRLMIVQYDLHSSNTSGQSKINKIVNSLNDEFDEGEKIWALTSSGRETIDEYKFENDVPYDFYVADPVKLKTIVRSNPGLLLLKDNEVLRKWPSTALPDAQAIAEYME